MYLRRMAQLGGSLEHFTSPVEAVEVAKAVLFLGVVDAISRRVMKRSDVASIGDG